MSKRIRYLFAWLVLAALPLQGFAAASMLFCGMGAAVVGTAQAHHDHAAHSHAHAHAVKGVEGGVAQQLPDAGHSCGVCAACCHGGAIAQTPHVLAMASLPLAPAAEPFVRIDPRPSSVPDKPPRS
ncbi:hypothetical protein ACFPOE_21675 [Caenimonas terrae]|uniref:DUF2946 domain-containing protein n=1 Tax=Caenimonas terrae TaxID=696074 RepID=A0ABW0NLC9_9BURK